MIFACNQICHNEKGMRGRCKKNESYEMYKMCVICEKRMITNNPRCYCCNHRLRKSRQNKQIRNKKYLKLTDTVNI